MNDRQALLVVDGLCKTYDRGQVKALDDISFTAMSSEVLALTGPSGCGKSSLLAILGLLDQPDHGSVRLLGQDLSCVARPGLFRAHHVGFVFQFHHMVPTMTLLENVAAPMITLGIARAERQERAMALLSRMQLQSKAHSLPAHVSGGERQRAAVARALVNNPRVILADEPTGNLDTCNGRIVVDMLHEHAHSGQALVIIATHNPEIATGADRCLSMLDGRMLSAAATQQHLES